ncbi:MAG TPA: class I SAM-dependent methyltransferase, partial [Rhodanobacteraceae bacterium]|nr:class I SAM-dependent methyltransferase [Rhodanobacteraceae bacterium]
IGTRVHGLLPRYVLAKLSRVPVVGFFVNWVIAFAGLPLMLRHQRAADTRNAAQFLEAHANAARIADDVRGTSARLDGVRGELGDANTRHAELQRAFDQRVGTLEARVGENESRLGDVPSLRHYVHAVNHWLVSLQGAIDRIDSASDANRAYADSLLAAVYDAGEVAAARGARQSAWIEALRGRFGATARIVDLGSGDGGWAAALASLGADVAGFESNGVLARRARERGLNVAAGDPLTELTRCNDASLDVITVSGAPTGDAFATLLAESARALKPGGWLLIAAGEPRRLADLASGRIGLIDRAVAAAMLGAAGFAVDGAFGGPDAVLAWRA